MRASGAKIDGFDGLRGLAAIGVVVLHVCECSGLTGYPSHLYLAVPLFFMLSGFVIARTYEPRLEQGMPLTQFARVRAIRLLPLLFASCLIAWMLGARPADSLAAALLIPSAGSLYLFPANSPVWSLFFEAWGNAFHGVFRRELKPTMLAAFVAFGLAGVIVSAAHIGDLAVGWAHGNFASGLAVFVFSYAGGIALWRLERAGRDPLRARLPFLWLALAYGLAVAWPQSLDSRWSGLRDAAVVVGLFPLLVALARHATMPGWIARLCRAAGAVSYPLYILHHPIVDALCTMLRPVTTTAGRYVLIAPISLFCITVAWAADRWFDRPVRALLGQRRASIAAI